MDLLERSSLLDELSGVLAATATRGRVVLVAGEAGIGKSALVSRFTERHSADARFLLGACDPLLTPRALGPLHDVARQTGGELAALLSLSAKTVGHHVSALLAKLGVGSRRQAAAVARRLGVVPAKDGEPGGQTWGGAPDSSAPGPP